MKTLTGIDRINGTRSRKARFHPQENLSAKMLEDIRERELTKLKNKHKKEPEVINDLAICFVTKEEFTAAEIAEAVEKGMWNWDCKLTYKPR